MTWTKTCDSVLDNIKLQMAGSAGAILHHMAQVWSNKHGTGGFIPRLLLRQVWNPPGERFNHKRVAERLVELRLFEDATHQGADGWFIHDFYDYQLTPAQAARDRAGNRERQARFRERQKAKKLAEQEALEAAVAAPPVRRRRRPCAQEADSVHTTRRQCAVSVQSQTPQVREKPAITCAGNGVTNVAPVPVPDPIKEKAAATAPAPAALPGYLLDAVAPDLEQAPPPPSADAAPPLPDWAVAIEDVELRNSLVAADHRRRAWAAESPVLDAVPPPQAAPPPAPAPRATRHVGLFELPDDLRTVLSAAAAREFSIQAGWSPLTPPHAAQFARVRPTVAELLEQADRFKADIAGGKRNNRGNMSLACMRVEEGRQRAAIPPPLDKAPPGFVAELDHIGQEELDGPCQPSVALRLHKAQVTVQQVRTLAEQSTDWREVLGKLGVAGARTPRKVDRPREGMAQVGTAEAILALVHTAAGGGG